MSNNTENFDYTERISRIAGVYATTIRTSKAWFAIAPAESCYPGCVVYVNGGFPTALECGNAYLHTVEHAEENIKLFVENRLPENNRYRKTDYHYSVFITEHHHEVAPSFAVGDAIDIREEMLLKEKPKVSSFNMSAWLES